MKEQILKLKEEGKSYNEIKAILKCSKGTISYHCGEGQKEKSRNRGRRNKSKNSLISRVSNFMCKTKKAKSYYGKKINSATRDFQRRESYGGHGLSNSKDHSFSVNDVIEKFGEDTICYLSGEKINLIKDNHYCCDHKIPATRGGSNNIDNLGILHKVVNKMKSDLTIDEFIFWCRKICKYQKSLKRQ